MIIIIQRRKDRNRTRFVFPGGHYFSNVFLDVQDNSPTMLSLLFSYNNVFVYTNILKGHIFYESLRLFVPLKGVSMAKQTFVFQIQTLHYFY